MGSWSGWLLGDGLYVLWRGRLIGGNCERILMGYYVFRWFRCGLCVTRWGMFLRNEECGLLCDGNLGLLAEARYSRSGLYTGCPIANFTYGFVFVFPGQGNVFVDGLYGSVYMLGRSVEMSFGVDTDGTIVELSSFCYEQMFHVGRHIVDNVTALCCRMHSGLCRFYKVQIFVGSVGNDVLRVS